MLKPLTPSTLIKRSSLSSTATPITSNDSVKDGTTEKNSTRTTSYSSLVAKTKGDDIFM